MSNKIISNPEGTLHALPDKEVLVITSSVSPGKKPSSPVLTDTFQSREYHNWGDDNNYPKEVYEACKVNSIIPSTINWKSRALRSGGVRYGIIEGFKDDGTEIFKPLNIPEIETFLDRNDLDLYFEEAFNDLIWFSQAYPELTMQPDRSKIVSLIAQEATFCRLMKQDQKTGEIKHVLLDANWPKGTSDTWKKIPIVDPYFDTVANLRKESFHKFMYPLSIASPGKIYYQQPDWHSIIDGEWIDVANQIPKFKKHLMNNRMSLRWVVHVPDTWWEWKYPGFNNSTKYDDVKRKQIQTNELTKFQNLLSGIEKQGRVLIATYKTDQSGKDYTKWKFEAVDGKSESGEYMEESQEASSHILYALGVDGTLIGSTPGKQMGAGSGSDKRVAWNIFIINNKPLQDKVCKPLDLITKYNGWKGPDGKKIVWRFNNYLIATLDTGSAIKPASKDGQN